MVKVYQAIASAHAAMNNCAASGNKEWFDRHEQTIRDLVKQYLPSGSGFDTGTNFMFAESKPDKLIFTTEFHHMNEVGMYDGWTQHTITIRPTFQGFSMRISGRDRNDIKEYIGDSFHFALSHDLPQKES
jgi:hypothetical protein